MFFYLSARQKGLLLLIDLGQVRGISLLRKDAHSPPCSLSISTKISPHKLSPVFLAGIWHVCPKHQHFTADRHSSVKRLLFDISLAQKIGKATSSLPPSLPLCRLLWRPPIASMTHPGADSKRERGVAFDVPGKFIFLIIVPWTE